MVSVMGDSAIRGENVNRAVKGFALKLFKLKSVLLQESSTNQTETYYRETATDLTAHGETWDIKGVARGSAFPHVDPSWTKQQGRHLKHAAEGIVFMEDKMLDAIDVQARTIIRVARAISESVDQHIYSELIGATGIGTAAAEANWDAVTESTRKPITDLLKGRQNMAENNYDVGNLYILMTPHDYRALMENSKVINNPSFKTADVVSNGVVGQIVGGTIIESNSVDDDECLMIIGQRAATWKSAAPLTSVVIEDPGIKYTIRSWEMGQVQVTDPLAIYRITNTQKT